MTIDPYEVLGVARDASDDEIRSAYRRLARELHPDAGGVDEDHMALVNEAWRILGDPGRRAAYDSVSRAHPSARGASDVAGWQSPRRIHLLVIALVVLVLVVMTIVFLIGFGRVGVTPEPSQ